MLWATLSRLSLRRRLPNVPRLAIPLLANNLSNIQANNLSNIQAESAPLVTVLVQPSSSMAAVSKALPSCHGKVIGATQKLVSAGNHVR